MVNGLWLATSVATLALAHALEGDVASANALIDEGARLAPPPKGFRALARVLLGRACLHAGRDDEARALGEESLALARDVGQRGYEADALAQLGEAVWRSQGPAGEPRAAELLGAAIEVAEELELTPLSAKCHLHLGLLHSRTGAARAREELASAQALCAGLGLQRLAGRAGEALGALGPAADPTSGQAVAT